MADARLNRSGVVPWIVAVSALAIAWGATRSRLSTVWVPSLAVGMLVMSIAAAEPHGAGRMTNPERLGPICIQIARLPDDTSPRRRSWKATWSLANSARRAGFHVIRSERPDGRLLGNASALLIALPLAPIEDQGRICEWMEAGGHVVFCGGPRHASAVSDILSRAGVSVLSGAVGALPRGEAGALPLEVPRFPSAYRTSVKRGGKCESLFSSNGIRCAIRVGVGRGSLTVFADDSWPYGSTVEGAKGWHIGNLALLQRAWQGLGVTE